jgi:cysteine-rich repeat protein
MNQKSNDREFRPLERTSRAALALLGVFALAFAISAPAAAVGPVVLDFEGLADSESVANFYAGGTGGNGSGPGPNLGVSFESNAFARASANNTYMLFSSGPATLIDVPAGFETGFSLLYIALFPGQIVIYSGAGGTGTALGSFALPITASTSSFTPVGIAFTGIAKSVEFAGTADYIAFDNVTLGSETPVRCGDGNLDAGLEQCDDGNTQNGDGCSSLCRFEEAIFHDPVEVSDWPEAIQLDDSQEHAYLALRRSGLDIHDIADRDAPIQTGNFIPNREDCPEDFFADEVEIVAESESLEAVVSGGACGVVGVDVWNSSDPTFIDRIPVPFGLAEETTGIDSGANTILYVASYWQGLQIIEIIGDCSVSCEVLTRGSIGVDDAWGASLAVWMEVVPVVEAPAQILVYVASTEGLQIVDVSDPDAPVLLGRLDTNPANIALENLDDVPQDVVVSGGLAFVPLWLGGLIVVDVQNPANPVEIQRIAASPNTAFFKVEVSSQRNRVYVTEGISGLAVFNQLYDGTLALEKRFPIGVGDQRCNFSDGVSDACWAWGVDEVGELVGVTYGILGSPPGGGFQLISMPVDSVAGTALKTLQATPVPEPQLLILEGVGVLAVAGLGRLRRTRRRRATRSQRGCA